MHGDMQRSEVPAVARHIAALFWLEVARFGTQGHLDQPLVPGGIPLGVTVHRYDQKG